MDIRYNTYGPWLRKKFGSRVFKVSVDGGFSCPNRDGTIDTGGCIYCRNDSFRAPGVIRDGELGIQIQGGTEYLTRRFKAEKFLLYWQNYTNTHAPVEILRKLFLSGLKADPRIVGMTVGTRPDCLEDEKLDLLQEIAREYYVCLEIGMESCIDKTLLWTRRGHDFNCFLDTAKRVRKRGIPFCTHTILGFPEENRETLLGYPDILNRIGSDFVKFHHLHVIEGTPLAKIYQREPFPLFTYPEWLELICDILERLSPDIVVQRLFGWCPPGIKALPNWDKTRSEIILDISRALAARESWQGKKTGEPCDWKDFIVPD
jgi:uncharacterized protein